MISRPTERLFDQLHSLSPIFLHLVDLHVFIDDQDGFRMHAVHSPTRLDERRTYTSKTEDMDSAEAP
jgi:hypothetical protein